MYQRSEQEIMQHWKGDVTKPVVSVSTITYNHENYIAQTLDGLLMQETDFAFEILVNEDASTDNTARIIEEYEKKYPKIIKPLYQTENQYSKGIPMNSTFNFPRAQGEYIAMCEGDDYWTDPLKLQKQVSFLNKNLEYSLVGCNAMVIYEEDNFRTKKLLKMFKKDFDFSAKELMTMYTSPIVTLTAMFRNNLIEDFNKVPFERYWAGDKQLWMYLMQFGKGRFLAEVVGVYRKHSGGVTASVSNSREKMIKLIKSRMNNHEEWNKFYNYQYNDEIELLKHKENLFLALLYVKNYKIRDAINSSKYVELEKVTNRKHKTIVYVLKILNKVKEFI